MLGVAFVADSLRQVPVTPCCGFDDDDDGDDATTFRGHDSGHSDCVPRAVWVLVLLHMLQHAWSEVMHRACSSLIASRAHVRVLTWTLKGVLVAVVRWRVSWFVSSLHVSPDCRQYSEG